MAPLLMPMILLALTTAVLAQPAAESSDPALIAKAREEADAGRFAVAEKLLRERIADPNAAAVEPVQMELEILRRIRLDYNLTPEALQTQLKESIAEVTAQQIDQWREQGWLDYRLIDGQIRYFDRASNNLFRFCKQARELRQQTAQPARVGWKFAWPAHLARLLRMADDADSATVYPVHHTVTYRLSVHADHPRLKPGAVVRCWLPFPQEYRGQRQIRLLAASPAEYTTAPSGGPHRTVYFEQTLQGDAKAPQFEVKFEYVSSAYSPRPEPAQVKPYQQDSDLYRMYTAERLPHIQFTEKIRQVADEALAREPNPLSRARWLYRWVCTHIRYCSEREYSTIRNLSDKAITTGRGDCGVQALLLVTLYRAAGIPARWQSGWETKPNGSNMHDWAEFFVEPWGWLPADPSYGLQKHDDPRVREFFCGNIDPYRMIVNLDYARALEPAKTSFRSEPNDFQRGEIEIDGHNLFFDEWDYSFKVRTIPLATNFAALEEALDGVIPRRLLQGKISGAVILVGKKGKQGYETWQKAYGYKRTVPSPEPMPVDAIFDLASMTKPIATGTSLMVLADQGAIDVDDLVGDYLQEFRQGDKNKVTIRHLMTHTSGQRPYLGAAAQKTLRAEAGFPCPEAVRKAIRQLALTHEPGPTTKYSCLNAILCAEIVRKVTGMEHSDFAQKHIFTPLGMVDTGFLPEQRLADRLVPTTLVNQDHAQAKAPEEEASPGQSAERRPEQPLCFLGQVHDPLAAMQGGISGNAGLFSTVADLSRFAQMMMEGGQRDGVRILTSETVQRMTSVQNQGAKNGKGVLDRRGLLWDIYPATAGSKEIDQFPAYGHTGYTGTAIRFYPEQGLYIIALANRVHPDDSGKVGPFRQEVWRTVGEVLLGLAPNAVP
jgi:CubicO group peptidase (beta-lactamase class C family)